MKDHAHALRRYLLAAAMGTASHYLLMAVLVNALQWPIGIAAGAGASIGALAAYQVNRYWVFRCQFVHGRTLPRFMIVAGAGAWLNGLLVWVGTSELGAHWMLAQMVVTPLLFGFGYIANRHWSFSH